MSDLYIISKTERFNFLLKKRLYDFENLVGSVMTFNQMSDRESHIIHANPGSIIIIDGIIINNGINIENILQLAPKYAIVVVKNLYTNDEVYHFLRAGVKGLTSLSNCYTNIVNIVTGALRGEIYMSSNEVAHLFQHICSTPDTSELTDREQEVLPLIMNGFTYNEVATKLDISYETIKSHMKNIYKKLNVKTRSDLLRYNFSY